MLPLLARIADLVGAGRFRVSVHGFEELASDDISLADFVESLQSATLVEEYPTYHKGPCVLVLHRDRQGVVAHALWA